MEHKVFDRPIFWGTTGCTGRMRYTSLLAVLSLLLMAVPMHAQSWMYVGDTLASAAEADYTRIVFNNNTPYIVFSDYQVDNARMSVKKYSGGSWQYVGSAGFSGVSSTYGKLAFDSDNTPYVAYDDGDSNKVCVKRFTGSSWVNAGTGSISEGNGTNIAMTLDNSDNVYVAYADYAHDGDLVVRKYNSITWSTIGTAGISGGAVGQVSIVVNSANQPIVCYRNLTDNIEVKKFNGTSWQSIDVDPFSALSVAALEMTKAHDTLYVVFATQSPDNKLRVIRYDGTAWADVGSSFVSDEGVSELSIATGADGVPFVVYGSATGAVVKKLVGNEWTIVGDAGFGPAYPSFPTVAINNSGQPYAVFSNYDVGKSGQASVITLAPVTTGISGTLQTCTGNNITLTGTPAGGTWANSNNAVATVSNTGVVTALTTGFTTVSYTAGGTTVTKQVTVISTPYISSATVPPVCYGATTATIGLGGVFDTASFSYINNVQRYTVPAGINALYVDVAAAAGGNIISGSISKNGGKSGRVQAKLAVTPGQVLTLFVGGQNGYNGGGTGTTTGGGASDVRVGGSALTNRAVVAGGGGGSAGTDGGAGGNLIGGDAPDGPNDDPKATGGVQVFRFNAGMYFVESAGNDVAGNDGTLGFGGNGNGTGWSGGGGGGGWYGGGGGAINGGAGGSSHVDMTLCSDTVLTRGYNSGNGYIKISPVRSLTYTIVWDAAALTAGFANASNVTLTAPSFNVPVPAGVAPGTYNCTVTVSNGTCTSNMFATSVTILALPAVNAGNDTSICATATATLHASGATTYTWSPVFGLSATTGASVAANPSVTTTYVVSGNNGTCTNTDTITVTQTGPLNISVSGGGPVCTGGSTSITATGADTYSWTPATGLSATDGSNVVSTPTTSVTYTVTGYANGCNGSATKVVSVRALPAAAVDTAISVCKGLPAATMRVGLAQDSFVFTYTGAVQTYTVPAGYDSIDADVFGAAGAFLNTQPISPGSGGRVRVRMPVTEGLVLNLFVGGIQRFNGGGASSYPGGDASDIRIGGAGWEHRRVVAGGGGGVGVSFGGGSAGGAGGDTVGEASYGDGTIYISAGGGTQFAGGVGGVKNGSNSGNGNNGTFFKGGKADVNGGGGGGGWYGGGGGAPQQGGGGGSSYADPAYCSKVYMARGVNGRGFMAYPWIMGNAATGSGDGFIIISPVHHYTYSVNWDANAVTAGFSNIGATTFSPGTINLPVPDNAVAGAYNGTVTISDGLCDSTYSFRLNVLPVPVMIATTPDLTKCAGDTTGAITFTAVPDTATFSWTNSNAGIGLGASGSGNISSFTTTNFGTVAQSGTVIVRSQIGTCYGNSDTFSVTVKPKPTVYSMSGQSLCDNATTNAINFFGYITGTTYTWSNSNSSIGLASSGTGDISAFTATNHGDTPVIATITISPSYDGCTGASTSLSITVNPIPTVYGGGNTAVCIDDNVTLTASGATSYSWSPAAGLTGTTGASVVASPASDITYTVTGTARGCINTDTVHVTVNPIPTVNTVSAQTHCNGDTSNTIIFTGNVPGTSYSWQNSNSTIGLATSGTGTIASFTLHNSGNTNAVATVTVTPAANGCVGSPRTFGMTVKPTPAVDTIFSQALCNGSATSAVHFSGAVSGTVYSWSNSNSAISLATSGTGDINSFTAVNTGTVSANATITVTPTANGCVGAARTFGIEVYPTPVVDPISNQVVCNGATTTLVNMSGPVAGSVYNWTNSDTTVGLTGSGSGNIAPFTAVNTVDYPTLATVSVVATANNCTSSTRTFSIRVNPTPVIEPTADFALCNGANSETIIFDTHAAGFASAAATPDFTWVNNNTGIGLAATGSDQINSFTAVNTTTDPVTATVIVSYSQLGCAGVPDTFVITVYPTPVLTSTLTATPICNNTLFSYTPASATTGTAYAWSRSTIPGISNTATAATGDVAEVLSDTTADPVVVSYVYTLTANGCTNEQTATVTVYPTPMLSSSLTISAVCDSSLLSYTPASLTSGTAYTWSRAAVAGISNSAATGAGDPAEYLVNTTPDPVNVEYVYTLTANGCNHTQPVTSTVYPMPLLSSALTPAAICDSAVFAYTPSSLTAGTHYRWSRGVVAGINNPANADNTDPAEALYNTTAAPIAVTYVYTLTANGCEHAQNVTVTVNPTPTLSSTLTSAAVCDDVVFNYTPTSATTGTVYAWSRSAVAGISNTAANGLGDPAETLHNTTADPVTVTYVYTLTANACTHVQNVAVDIKPTPVLSSTLTPAAICDSATFNYTPSSATEGTSFAWSRAAVAGIANTAATGADDPAEALYNTTTAPVQVTYTYTLVATGCNHVQDVPVTVNPTPKLTSVLTAPAICNGTTFNYTPTSATVGTAYAWSRAMVTGISNVAASGTDDPAEMLNNPTVNPVALTYIYTLTANGCSFSQPVGLTVNPTPRFITAQTGTVCSGAPYTYVPASATAGVSYAWTRAVAAGISNAAGSGSGSVGETLYNTTLAAKTTTYHYTLTANGCSNQQNVVVTVDPTPQAPVITVTSPANVCSQTMNMNFGAATTQPDTVQYTWTADGATVLAQGAGHQNAIISFPTAGDVTVVLTANATGFSCTTKDTFQVNVGSAIANNAEIYYIHDHFIYTDNTVDGYQWGYDDAATLDSVIYTGQVDQNLYLPSPDFAGKKYWVIVNKGGCLSKSYYNAPTGVADVNSQVAVNLLVVPNPASDHVSVVVEGVPGGNDKVALTDLTGKTVITEAVVNNKAQLSVSNLASGIYVVTYYHNGVKAGTAKLVKE